MTPLPEWVYCVNIPNIVVQLADAMALSSENEQSDEEQNQRL